VLDRSLARPVIMVSSAGGMEIEEVAARTPELIIKEAVDPAVGLLPFQTRNLAFGAGLPPEHLRSASGFITNLYKMFVNLDCSLAEINPLVLTDLGELLALDAKINLDDNALFRHHDLAALDDPEEIDPLEHEAREHHLNYIRLSGNIGAMVNEVQVKVPIIIRLEGTNVEEGRRLLNESGLTFTVAQDMQDAARKVAALVH
jgi:succinyl-CoA synthetase beta subunit